jgi:hypothetical protein
MSYHPETSFTSTNGSALSSGSYKAIMFILLVGIVVVGAIIVYRVASHIGASKPKSEERRAPAEAVVVSMRLDGTRFATLPRGRLLDSGDRFELAFQLRVDRGTFGSALILGDPSLKARDELAYIAFTIVSGRVDPRDNGKLQMLAYTARNSVDLTSREVINDGRARYVRLKRLGDRWELLIDGSVHEDITTPMVVMPPAALFIGGLETFDGPAHYTMRETGMRGTIGNVMLNGLPITAFVMIEFSGTRDAAKISSSSAAAAIRMDSYDRSGSHDPPAARGGLGGAYRRFSAAKRQAAYDPIIYVA